ncbi:MAG: MMPL family transporter [Phycisphaerae bacterium]|nr:MMPL family transporter [Phycisphaerae bacterium]
MAAPLTSISRRTAVLVLVAWILLAVGLAVTVHKNDADADDGAKLYLPDSRPSQAAQQRLREVFPGQCSYSTALVVLHSDDGIDLGQLIGPDGAVARLVGWIRDPVELPDTVSAHRADQVRRALRDAPVRSTATDLQLIHQLTARRDDGVVTSALVAVGMPDIFTARRTQAVVKALRGHLEAMQADGTLGRLQFDITGDAGFYLDYNDATAQSVERSTVVTVVLVMVILLAVYRSPVAVLVPLATLAAAVHVAMRTLYALAPLGLQADPAIEMLVVVILFGSGTDYCLFIIARYKEAAAAGGTLGEAMASALRGTGAAILASALTTMAGLSLMCLAEFRAFQKAGPSIAVALGVGCLASMTLAPALYLLAGRLLFWPARGGPAARSLTGGLWQRLAAAVTRRPMAATVLVLAILAAPSAASFTAATSYNIFDELSGGWSSVRGFEILRRDFSPGTMGPLTVLVRAPDGKGNLLDDAAAWSAMGRLADRLAADPMVENVFWPGQPLGLNTVRYPTPADLARSGLILRAVRANYYTDDRTAAKMTVLLREGPYADASIDAAGRLRHVAELAAADPEAPLETAIAGPSATLADIRDTSRRDFVVVTAAVLIAVYLILLVVLRRPVLGLFLIGGTVLSFTAALGAADWVFVRWLGETGLDWKVRFFLLVILVAVGVDYNIYVCTRIAQERRRLPLDEAVRVALERTGGIVSACGLIVAGTFASMIAGNLSLMIQLGFALAVGILVDTFLVRPLLVPAIALMLARADERRRPRGAADGDESAPSV